MEGRTIIRLSECWGFMIDPERTGVEQRWQEKGLPSPESVQIPHTWNVDPRYETYRGQAWYEYVFSVPEQWQDQMVRIRFEAVYRDAHVWLNGIHVGSHSGSGYTPFLLDLTNALRPSEENRLVVSVDNAPAEYALPQQRSFDWADDGGMIREAKLIVTGPSAIDWLQVDAIPLFTGSVDQPIEGRISIRAFLCGGEVGDGSKGAGGGASASGSERENLTYHVRVKHAGEQVWSGPVGSSRLGDAIQLAEIRLEDVRLWHFDHPHLYELEVDLMQGNRLLDRYASTIGFREIQTVGQELWLNREPVRLFGVEWMPGSNPAIGMAEREADLTKFLEQIKHANCVITRFHWQQDEQLLDWCDRNGLLVQEEIPHWQQPAIPGQETLELAKQQAHEMITRHYNHPCIYAWGMGNEIDGQAAGTSVYMRELLAYMQTLDDRRFINYVSNTIHLEPQLDAAGTGDVLMWNEYIGTWHGDLDFEEVIGRIEGAHPHKPICIAEYGLCEPAFEGGDARRAQFLSDKTALYRTHPGIAYLIYFSLNDYRTQMGEEGEGRFMQRVHGSVDVYGKPKPSYHVLRELAAPIVPMHIDLGDEHLTLRLQTRSDIPSYRVTGYQLRVDLTDGTAVTLAIPDLSPGDETALSVARGELASDPAVLTILRPTGSSVWSHSLP